MSAFGTKRTFRSCLAMSAFGGIADIQLLPRIRVIGRNPESAIVNIAVTTSADVRVVPFPASRGVIAVIFRLPLTDPFSSAYITKGIG
jgi:hypothetical protein